RSVHAILDARCDEPDDALVPVGFVQAQRKWQRVIQRQAFENRERVRLHLLFDVAAIAVQFVEPHRERTRALDIVGEQTLDAERHVFKASGGIQARTDRETEIGRDELFAAAIRDIQQRLYSRTAASGANAL